MGDNRDELGRFTKGNPNAWDSESAAEAAKKATKARMTKKHQAQALLDETGLEDDEITQTLRILAERAVDGNQSDMRLFLQQTQQLKNSKHKDDWDGSGPCPTCGLDPTEGLVITGKDLQELQQNMDLLDELLTRSEEFNADRDEDIVQQSVNDAPGGGG